MVRSSTGEWRSDSKSMNSTSPMIEETGARNGGSTLGGSDPDTNVSFSVTVWRARLMSCSQSNSTHTTATPTAVAERTRRTPAAPFSADSIGNVTSDSISSGSIPGASARIVTVGAVRSGSTSRGMRVAVHPPQIRNAAASAMTIGRCPSDQRMSPSIMFSSLGRRSATREGGAQCTCPWAGTDVDNEARRTR